MGFGEVTARIPRRLLSICGRQGSKCSLSLFLHWCVKDEQNGPEIRNVFGALSFAVSLKLGDVKTETDGGFVLPLHFICASIWKAIDYRFLELKGASEPRCWWFLISDGETCCELWTGARGQLAKHINSRGFYGFHHLIPLSAKAVMTYSTLNETPLPRNKHVSLSSGIMWIILASKFSSDVVNITSRGTSLMSTSPTTKVGFDHQRADQGKLNASKAFLFETSRHQQHLKPLRVHGTPRTLRVLGGQRSTCIGHRSGSQYPTPSKGVATRLKFCTSLQCK